MRGFSRQYTTADRARQRRREIGTLHALGLRGRQIAASILMGTTLLVIVVSILAVPLGAFNNYVNTLTMEDLFALRFTLSPGDGIAWLAALLLATVPARQAGRVDVLDALCYE